MAPLLSPERARDGIFAVALAPAMAPSQALPDRNDGAIAVAVGAGGPKGAGT